MKKMLLSLFAFAGLTLSAQCPWSFSLSTSTGNFNLPCTGPLTITATSNSTNTINYTWLGGAGISSVSPTAAKVTAPGNYTVIAINAITSCSASQVITVYPEYINFSLQNVTESFSITCAITTILMNAVTTNTTVSYNYLWTGPSSFSAPGQTVGITTPGNYSLTVTNSLTGCSNMQTFGIGVNTTAPTNSVNPITQLITCTASAISFTGTCSSPSINVKQEWFGPYSPANSPLAATNNTTSLLSYPNLAPGEYSLVTTDLVNGCSTTKTVSITSANQFPTFNISSTSNFILGCGALSQSTVCIINPVTTGPSQYTIVPPTSTSPINSFGAISCASINTPGTWTAVVNDMINGCITYLPFTVTQNTVVPVPVVSIPTQTLTCFNPTVLASINPTAGITSQWLVPSTPSVVNSASVIVGPPTGPSTSSLTLTYATYTALATNTLNGCSSSSVIAINQNFKAPIPKIAIGTPSFVGCSGIPVQLSFTSNPITSGIIGAYPTVQSWMGPAPQVSVANVAQYSAYVPGTYSLTMQDSKNGCVGTGTINVNGNTTIPVLQNPVQTITTQCEGDMVTAVVTVSNSSSVYYYKYVQYPLGAIFSPTSLVSVPGSPTGSATISGPSGQYLCQVTNIITGCTSTAVVNIYSPEGSFTISPTPPTCSSCCDGVIGLTPPAGFTTYSVSTNMGTVTGNPPNAINALCYGNLKYCIVNTQATNCKHCDSIIVNGTVGIKTINWDEEISVYPNPSTKDFSFVNKSSGSMLLKVYGYDGKEVLKGIAQPNSQSTFEILQSGIYILEIRNGSNIYRKKLLVLN